MRRVSARWVPRISTSVSQSILLHMKKLKIKVSLSFFECSFPNASSSMMIRSLFYLTADGVKCRIKRFPVLHCSADYNFTSFGICLTPTIISVLIFINFGTFATFIKIVYDVMTSCHFCTAKSYLHMDNFSVLLILPHYSFYRISF